MTIFPAAFFVFAIWGLLVLKSSDHGFTVTIAVLPFGMFAALSLPSLGNLSLLVSSVLAGFMIGLGVLRFISRGSDQQLRSGVPTATIAIIAFALYGVFSAIVLVRLFAGEFRVFSLSRSVTGARIDPAFASITVPLAPGSSNISQTFYVVLACGFFLVLADFLRRNGAVAGEKALRIAAFINAVLGLLDMAKLDALLAPVRTASYTLANNQMMGGFDRVIGGYSEPSSFGTASAVFFAYFASAYFHSHRMRDAIPAVLNGFFVIASFAATAFFAFGVVVLILATRSLVLFSRTHSRSFLLLMGAALFLMIAMLALLVATTPFLDVAYDSFDRLVLSKAGSMSGLERRAWAEGGLLAFRETWGLGAGVGSLRSNGLISVLLGNVGIPGTAAFVVFIWYCIGRSAPPAGIPVMRRIYLSARLAVIAKLSADLLSSTVPDPGLLLMTLAATAMVARETAQLPARSGRAVGLQPSIQPE